MDPSSFEQKFSCPICFEIPKRKIFQCRNGHIICESCSRQLWNCPQCRVHLETSKIRNLALEDVLKDLALLRNNRATNFYWTERTGDRHYVENSSTNSGVIFNLQCQWCMEIPLKHARYVCLCCRLINCCAKCFSNPSEGLATRGSQNTSKCRQNHVFALITTIAQDKAFKKAHIERNGAPFLKDVNSGSEIAATSSRCHKCQDWLTEGYICTMDHELKLFCSACYNKTSLFKAHKDAFLPVANRAQTLLSIDPNPALPVQMNSTQNYISFESSVNVMADACHNPGKYVVILILIRLCFVIFKQKNTSVESSRTGNGI